MGMFSREDRGFIAFIAVCIMVTVCAGGYWITRSKEIETEHIKIQEQEETERTEENAQFWQKLVPWGEDEDEESK